MDTPRVALRFRDVGDGIDTIGAHRSVIDKQGAVWWGWWKKKWEPDFAATFVRLAEASPGRITLIDRSTKRAFTAKYLQATQEAAKVDPPRIPDYYRDEASSVSGWFLLDEILDVSFDEAMGRRLGETTFLLLDSAETPVSDSRRVAEVPTAEGRNHILHLSDLHFGGEYAFLAPGDTAEIGQDLQTLTKCLVEDLTRLGVAKKIALVVATGDFTTRGDWSDKTKGHILDEFSSLLSALGLTQQHLLAAPGNHDIQRFPEGRDIDAAKLAVSQQTTMEHETHYRLFQEQLTGRRWQEPLNYSAVFNVSGVEVRFAMLNSCAITATKWTEYGFVSTGGFDVLRSFTDWEPNEPCLGIMALHHHLMPVSAVEAPESRGVSVTLNAIDLLDAAARAGIGIALHGHQHLARVSSYARLPFEDEGHYAPLVIISGGSVGGARLPGAERNTYSLLRVATDDVTLCMRELRPDAKPGKTLFQKRIPVQTGRPTSAAE